MEFASLLFTFFILFFQVASLILDTRIDLVEYPNARCNDGSNAVYYFKQGSDPKLWLLNLEGGGWCWNNEMCSNRCSLTKTYPDCGSSKLPHGAYPSKFEASGIFDERDDNPLKDANKVLVLYCSSDGWMGRSHTGPLGYQFKGAYIIDAVIQDLVSRFGLGVAQEETTVVFGGQNAGARGAMLHMDRVSQWFLSRPNSNIIVRGWLDSPFWLPLMTINGRMSLLDQTKKVYEFANNTDLLNQDCLTMYHYKPHYCMFGYFLMPFLKTSSVLQSAIFDIQQLGANLGRQVDTPEDFQYASKFASDMTHSLVTLAMNNSNVLVFGPGCCNHAVSISDDFYNMKSFGHSEASMLSKLLSTSGPFSVADAIVDVCAIGMKPSLCCGDLGTVNDTCKKISHSASKSRNSGVLDLTPFLIIFFSVFIGATITAFTCFTWRKLKKEVENDTVPLNMDPLSIDHGSWSGSIIRYDFGSIEGSID